ncbi:hypothetical protein [Cryocola sp. 340MFSha3.1]|uniref:hypothetical protein n=1 Tax=Cryocola sp. 340MFSha3.1 TaxID=1169145 RepID=UPI00036B91D3|nr:hypothetical protein [Cryocola sp. 340MFSha3.1]
MKSAFVVSEDRDLFEKFASLLAENGGHRTPDMAQLVDAEGRMLTVFAMTSDEWLAELQLPPETPERTVGRPPVSPRSSLTACTVECRWETVFVSWVQRLARQSSTDLWVLDGDDVLWASDQLDADALRL